MKNTATIITLDISQLHIVLSYFQKRLNPSGNLVSAYRNSLQPLLYPSVHQPTAPSASCTGWATVLWRTNTQGNLPYLCPLPTTFVSPAGIFQATPRRIFFLIINAIGKKSQLKKKLRRKISQTRSLFISVNF